MVKKQTIPKKKKTRCKQSIKEKNTNEKLVDISFDTSISLESKNLDYLELINTIEKVHDTTQRQAIQAVNIILILRNWIIGYYIVEYEQKGEDRAKYGKNLLNSLAIAFRQKGLKGFSGTNLRLYRLFYLAYPQISQLLYEKSQDGKSLLPESVWDLLGHQFNIKEKFLIHQSVTDKSMENNVNPYTPKVELLLKHFSFTHFVELIKIDNPIKRAFYEIEGIKGNWSVRQLKRQIESLLFERTGLSKNKNALLNRINRQEDISKVEDVIRDPYFLEFAGLQERSEYSESELETALIDHLQEFLLELGNGFCFEARQKRITVDDEHDRVDLVFYHRILKCHILIDLKTRKFSYADAGQMNFYLNYFKENVMTPDDNPPVGLILCTDKTSTKVKYAISGMDNQLFVSKYLVSLPSEEELEKFIVKNRKFIETYVKK